AQASDALDRLSLPDFLPVLQIAADCRQQTIKDQLLDGIHEIDRQQGVQVTGAPPACAEVPPSAPAPTAQRCEPHLRAVPPRSPAGVTARPAATVLTLLAAVLKALRHGGRQGPPSGNGPNGDPPPSPNDGGNGALAMQERLDDFLHGPDAL